MVRAHRRLIPAVLVLCALQAGCATRVKVLATDPALADRLAEVPLVAVGGVAVAPTLGADLAPADADDAAAAVQRAILGNRPDLEVWPLSLVEERLGAGALAGLLAEYGRLGRLRPDQILPLRDDLAACRLLVVARLTGDDVRSLSQPPHAPDPATGTSDRQEPGGTPWSTTISTERTVTLTLEVFDLIDGRSVWQAEARARARTRYRYEDRLRSDPGRYLQERLAAAASAPVLERRGEFLHLPDLVELIEQAAAAMVEKLPAARR